MNLSKPLTSIAPSLEGEVLTVLAMVRGSFTAPQVATDERSKMKPDLLIVATHKNWIADEFADTGYVDVKHSFGLDVPIFPEDKSVAWWMPTEVAARFARSGAELNLATIDAEWLTRVPKVLLGREVWVGTARKALELGISYPAYCKPAEVKISAAPAQWIEVDYFVNNLLQLGVPEETKVQVTSTFLDIKYEYRCFVNQGSVVAVATYLTPEGIFGQDSFTRNVAGEERAQEFAQEVTSVMGADQPCAYTLDIAELATGELIVMEANPVWASNPYDCDKLEAVKSVITGSRTQGGAKTHGKFQWELDPYLTWYAQRRPLLPKA